MTLSGEDIYRKYEWKYKQEDLKFCPRCGQRLSLESLHIPEELQLVCHECQFILYIDPKLVVTGVVQNNNDVLLLRRAEQPNIGLWGLPGGHVQRGEDPQIALMKEVRQEAEIEVSIVRLLDIYSIEAYGLVQLAFLCQSKTRIVKTNIESYEAKFFSQDEIPWEELAFKTTRDALNMAGYNMYA